MTTPAHLERAETELGRKIDDGLGPWEWIGHYDLEGRPCTFGRWAELTEARGAELTDRELEEGRWVVRKSGRHEVTISTVWLGLDHNFASPGNPPLIYETMVFGGPLDGEQWRWPTREAAEAGHREVVALVELEARATDG